MIVPRFCFLVLGGFVATSLSGCAGASVTNSIEPVIELTMQGAAEGGEPRAPSVTTATSELAVLEGTISSPNPCYSFAAEIEADQNNLTVTLSGTQQAGMCIQILGAFRYQARITGLSTGTYPVTVVYRYPDTGWEQREFSLTLTIP